MTPRSFDSETCRELVGDERARQIEAQGRSKAEQGIELVRPPTSAITYWGMVQEDAAFIVECDAYRKRKDRMARKAKA